MVVGRSRSPKVCSASFVAGCETHTHALSSQTAEPPRISKDMEMEFTTSVGVSYGLSCVCVLTDESSSTAVIATEAYVLEICLSTVVATLPPGNGRWSHQGRCLATAAARDRRSW